MTAGYLAGVISVAFVAVMLCLTPVLTRPTVPFGVRVPSARAGASVIRRQRKVYFWRTAAVGVCGIVATLFLPHHGPPWVSRIILLAEIAADLSWYLLARQKITAAKAAEDWFAGQRQIVATDTTWRTDPPRFPVRWLIPALTVIAATIVVGVIRYPDLPARLAATGWGGRHARKSVVTAFAIVAAQLWVTVEATGLLVLVYRSRPDIEATDPATSTGRYRRYLTAMTRAILTLVALVDLTLLLVALRVWQVYQLSGAASTVVVLPFAAGLIILGVVAYRTGQGGSRLSRGAGPRRPAAGTDRDDDRFWKAGLFYVNRDDPALMVGARFGVGWTFNFGNRIAWLIVAVIVATPLGLVLIALAVGM
jgi:uncharacterized membrane protein